MALLLADAVPDLVAGVLVGATLPQLAALSAARWSALLSGERAAVLPTAFALEALANGASYLAGPALVSFLGAAGRPDAGPRLPPPQPPCAPPASSTRTVIVDHGHHVSTPTTHELVS